MRKVIDFFVKIPIVWLVLFFIIGTVNLSAPLFVSTLNDNRIMLEQIDLGLNEIDTDMVVRNGQLSAESEVVHSNSDNMIYILDHSEKGDNYIHFRRESVEINIKNHNNLIDYEEEMNKYDIVSSVQEQMALATMLSTLANSFVYLLSSVIVFLMMLIASHYILKKREKFRALFRLLSLPYLAGGYLSMLLTLVISRYHFVYMFSILMIGLFYAYVLKNKLEDSINDFYFGKGE